MTLADSELAERIDTGNVPELLKSLPQWVMWKYQHLPGKPKPKKPPFQTNGRAASVDDPQTWSSYRQVIAALDTGGYQGIGFMLSGGIVVIDLDNCLVEVDGVRRITKLARQVFDIAHSYTEISPSGKGLHIFLRGSLPERNGQPQGGMKSDKGEIYEAKRYITVTGERVGDAAEIREDQEAIHQIYALLKAPQREQPRPEPGRQGTAARTYRQRYHLTSEDEKVLDKAGKKAANRHKFNRLYYQGSSTEYPSKSEAQLALIAMLVYWTNGDARQVERLFKDSAMYRQDEDLQKKWHEKHYADGKTYGRGTIEKAIESSISFKR